MIRSGQILVVDDDPAIRSVLEAVLTAHRYQVVTAENGRDALMSIDDVAPNVILLDLYMPVMDGWEMLAFLQQHHPHVPVIVMSAAPPERVSGRLDHAAGYLPTDRCIGY